MQPPNHEVPEGLRNGKHVRDATFDLVYPEIVRRVSSRFWTPIEVARTAARWLAAEGARSVLDVGSGPGKFCIVAGLTTDLQLTGLEQRQELVDVARAASEAYGACTEFRLGTLETLDPAAFDAFYLFNPFGENLYPPEEQFDGRPELSALRYSHDLSIFEHWLDHARVGTCMATYHGFGGRIPNTYELVRSLPKGSDRVRLWKKVRPGHADRYMLEREYSDDVTTSRSKVTSIAGRRRSP
jgi:SAM-dependent methyltransferase